MAVTQGIGFQEDIDKGMSIDFIDVRRTYFHSEARREVYVRLPPEDDEPGMCGLLFKAFMAHEMPHRIGKLHIRISSQELASQEEIPYLV